MSDGAFEFDVGEYVRRKGRYADSWSANGHIIARFRTSTGKERYVFEFELIKGMLYIVSPGELVTLND